MVKENLHKELEALIGDTHKCVFKHAFAHLRTIGGTDAMDKYYDIGCNVCSGYIVQPYFCDDFINLEIIREVYNSAKK